MCDAALRLDARADAKYCSDACRRRARRTRPDLAAHDRATSAAANRRRYATPDGRRKMIASVRAYQQRRMSEDPDTWRQRRHAYYRRCAERRDMDGALPSELTSLLTEDGVA